MDFIKAGLKVSQTIRNVARLREIVSIFARHGFEEFVSLGLTAPIPGLNLLKSKIPIREELSGGTKKDFSKVIGFRLRKCFEELGPAFIKLGQLLSSREDIFEDSFILEMKLLRDKVAPVPFEEVRPVIEEMLGGAAYQETFKVIDPVAIGTASIGVVFKGALKSGEDIVIKVKRPNIERMIETDFSILMSLVTQIEKRSKEFRFLGVSKIIRDFSATIKKELNFNLEALNSKRLAKNIATHDTEKIFYIPKVFNEYTCRNVLVMERLQGIPFSDSVEINKIKDDVATKMEMGIKIFISSFLKDGFYHADLHGGNFFFLKNKQIGLIDFGVMGSLSKKSRMNFIAILYALISYNYENLVYEFLDVAEYEKIPDVDGLVADVKEALSPFIGLTVSQTSFSEVFGSIVKTINEHQIFLPRDWFVLFRAFVTLDGVGRTLDMDFDLFSILEEEIEDILKDSFKKEDLIEETAWATRDLISSLRMFPRHLKWFVKDIAKKNYAISLVNSGYEKQLTHISRALIFCGLCFLSGVLFLAGASLLITLDITSYLEIPIICWTFWGLSVALFSLGGLFLRKN